MVVWHGLELLKLGAVFDNEFMPPYKILCGIATALLQEPAPSPLEVLRRRRWTRTAFLHRETNHPALPTFKAFPVSARDLYQAGRQEARKVHGSYTEFRSPRSADQASDAHDTRTSCGVPILRLKF